MSHILKITIRIDTPAFDVDPHREVGCILRDLARKFDRRAITIEPTDTNGEVCGSVELLRAAEGEQVSE